MLFAAVAGGASVFLWLRPNGLRQKWWRPPPVLVIAVVGSGVLVDGRVSPVLVVLGVGGAAAAVREVRRRRSAIVEQRRSEAVLAMCESVSADLHAGRPPIAALTAAADEWSELRGVADAARLGADVPAALRSLSERPGAEQLVLVAAAWVVAHRSGAGLAAAVDLAARAIREDRAAARVVSTELASAHATARLLAVLPVGVLLIGRGSGGDPFGFLLSTTPGLFCLAMGLGLAWAGLFWMQRIADGIRRA